MTDPSLAQRIFEIAMRYASEAQAQRGGGAYLVIGVRRDAQGEKAQIDWDVVCRGALAEAARQHFERALLMLKCCTCGSIFELTESAPVCPACGSVSVAIIEAEGHPFEDAM